MVRGQAPLQAVEPLPVAEHGQVLAGDGGDPGLHHPADLGAFVRGGEAQPGGEALLHRGVAAGPAEDEQDGREQPLPVEPVDDVRAHRATPAGTAPPAAGAGAAALAQFQAAHRVAGVAQQLGVHVVLAGGVGVVEQVEHPLADEHVLPQRHRPVLGDHHRGLAAHGDQPVRELLGVGDGGRQRHERDRLGQVDDHLFPDPAAEPVGQVVDLVHHHVRQALQRRRARVEHVAQHLGGHHHHRRVAVYRVVAGEQADVLGAVAVHHVVVLLVGQRLDRRGVEALAPGRGRVAAGPAAQRQVHRELTHHGLAGAGGRAHQHAAAPLQRLARLALEVVEIEPEIQ